MVSLDVIFMKPRLDNSKDAFDGRGPFSATFLSVSFMTST